MDFNGIRSELLFLFFFDSHDTDMIYYQSDNPFACRKALVEPLAQIQTWLMQHLAYESFNGMDNTDQVDLWPFFILPHVRAACCAEDLRRQISNDIALALEICGPTTFFYQLGRDKSVETSDQTILLCCLMPYILQWLKRTNLLGRYAMTSDRSAVALLRTSRYLLTLTKDQLAEVLNDGKPGSIKVSPSMHLARKAFCTFMRLASRTTELYFFVLYMHSVIVYYRLASRNKIQQPGRESAPMSWAAGQIHQMATDAERYLEKVSR